MRIFRPNKKQRKAAGRRRYLLGWGNYKTHKWKKKRILREEIREVLIHGVFNKPQLIEILDMIRKMGLDLEPLGTGTEKKPAKKKGFITQNEMEL